MEAEHPDGSVSLRLASPQGSQPWTARAPASLVLDGPINRVAFETYVEKVLVPELRQGDTVILDNLPGHKGPRVRQLIEAAGARLLYLPPYSPDFNPIENAFAKLKALLRKAAERTVEGSGSPLANSSTSSATTNAATSSPPPATMQTDPIPL